MGLGEKWRELDRPVRIVIGLCGAAVAAAVLLFAAVVLTFVLGLGIGGPDAGGAAPGGDRPIATFTFETAEETVTITHDGGDALAADNVTVRVNDRSVEWPGEGQITRGDAATVDLSRPAEIRVVWSSGEESYTLAAYQSADY